MNDDRLYFTQQPYNWIGAEEEIVSKEDMFQEATTTSYEIPNYYMNGFHLNYDSNKIDTPRRDFATGVIFQPNHKPTLLTSYKTHQSYPDRVREISAKPLLLKRMLEAPLGANLEEIAAPDPYLPNWQNSQFSVPNDLLNDGNSDTITADSEGNEMDTWDNYKYNGLVAPNFFMPKPVQNLNPSLSTDMYQYQNSNLNSQESCKRWLASNFNSSNDLEKKDAFLSIYCENGQIQYQQPRMDLTFLASNQDPLDSAQSVFTMVDQSNNFGSSYYNQAGNCEDQTFVLPDQQPFVHQDTPANFVDCNNQYNYEFQYDNDNDAVTYTVLDDKQVQSNVLTEGDLLTTVNQTSSQVTQLRVDEMLQPYSPRWQANSEDNTNNLENMLNFRLKNNVDFSRDCLTQVNYCCKTPIISDKVNVLNLNSQLQCVLPIENRQHNFNSYSLLFNTMEIPETEDQKLQVEETLNKETLIDNSTNVEMEENLEQSDDYNYFWVQNYRECDIEGENGEVTTAILMPITDAD